MGQSASNLQNQKDNSQQREDETQPCTLDSCSSQPDISTIDFKKILADKYDQSSSSDESSSAQSEPDTDSDWQDDQDSKIQLHLVESQSPHQVSLPSSNSDSSEFIYESKSSSNQNLVSYRNDKKKAREQPPTYEEWRSMDQKYDQLTVFFEKLIGNGPGKNHAQSKMKFGRQLRELWQSSKPSSQDVQLRSSAQSRIQAFMTDRLPTLDLNTMLIGSSSSETWDLSSPLDLVVMPETSTKREGNAIREEWENVETVSKLLEEESHTFGQVKVVQENGSFISFVDLATNIKVHLRLNDYLAISPSGFVETSISLRPSLLKPLLHFVKKWARARELDEFDDYVLSLMVIWSLQQTGALPKPLTFSDDGLSSAVPNDENLKRWIEMEKKHDQKESDSSLGDSIYIFFRHFTTERNVDFESNSSTSKSQNGKASLIQVQDPDNKINLTSSISKSISQRFIKECHKAKASLENAANVSRIIRPIGWERGLSIYRRRYDEEKRKLKRQRSRTDSGKVKINEISVVERERVEEKKVESKVTSISTPQKTLDRSQSSTSIPTGPRALNPTSPAFSPRSFTQVASTSPSRSVTQVQPHSPSRPELRSRSQSNPNSSTIPIFTPSTQPRNFRPPVANSGSSTFKDRRIERESEMTPTERTRARRKRRERAKERLESGK